MIMGHGRNKGGNQKFPKFNENENTTYLNLWNTAKAALRGKFIAINAYRKRTERSQISAISQTPRKTRTSSIQNKQERNNKKYGPKSMK
jgi:hypothetical protein